MPRKQSAGDLVIVESPVEPKTTERDAGPPRCATFATCIEARAAIVER